MTPDELRALLAEATVYVVKTDGKNAGKGVLVTESFDEAMDDVRAKVERGAVVVSQSTTALMALRNHAEALLELWEAADALYGEPWLRAVTGAALSNLRRLGGALDRLEVIE